MKINKISEPLIILNKKDFKKIDVDRDDLSTITNKYI